MGRAYVKFEGATQMSRRIRYLAAGFSNFAEQSLRAEAEIEKKEVIESTPLKTGALRRSIRVEVLQRRRAGKELAVAIVAGGPTAPYAIIVHEDPDAFHPIGDWKYIEHPLNMSSPYMRARITRRLYMGLGSRLL